MTSLADEILYDNFHCICTHNVTLTMNKETKIEV
jgi:hypothetical protein